MFKVLAARGKQFLADQEGPTTVEYAVMLALIVAGAFTAITLLGTRTNGVFTNLDGDIPTGTLAS